MKVLLVDDSSFINLIARKALKDSGYDVVGEAYDGVQACEIAEKMAPDIVIMDIALPKMNGLQASQRILKAQPHIKILAMSALDEDWVKEQSLASGCISFLRKPFHAQDLVEAVRELGHPREYLKHG